MKLDEWYASDHNRQLKDEVRHMVSDVMPHGLRDSVMEWLELGLKEGHQFRPYLLLALNDQLNQNEVDEDLLRLAATVEILHQASLIVDDETDEHDIRGANRTALHTQYGHGIAATISHMLIVAAEKQIASTDYDPRKKILLYELLTRTRAEMAFGQFADAFFSEKPEHTTWVDWCLQEAYLKTRSLMSLPFGGTAVIKNLDAQPARQLTESGSALGALYQVGDDLRDIETQKGPLTLSLPLAVALDGATKSDQDFLREILKSRRLDERDARQLQKILDQKRVEILRVATEIIESHAVTAQMMPDGVPGIEEVAEMISLVKNILKAKS